MCPPWLGCCVRLAELVSCLSPWLGCCVLLLPTDLPTYLQRAELQVSQAVGPCPHFSCIAPSPYPPCIGACSGMPPVRATTKSEVQRSHFRPVQLCWVWPCQDYCLEPRPRKLSRACVGLAKRSPPTPWTEPFDGLPHGQSLVLLSQG